MHAARDEVLFVTRRIHTDGDRDSSNQILAPVISCHHFLCAIWLRACPSRVFVRNAPAECIMQEVM